MGCRSAAAVAHRQNVITAGNDPLGQQKALREFNIRPGGTHGDRGRRAVDPDLQRLLDHQGLRPRDRVLGGDVMCSPPGGDPSHGYARSSRITMAFDTGVFDFVAV